MENDRTIRITLEPYRLMCALVKASKSPATLNAGQTFFLAIYICANYTESGRFTLPSGELVRLSETYRSPVRGSKWNSLIRRLFEENILIRSSAYSPNGIPTWEFSEWFIWDLMTMENNITHGAKEPFSNREMRRILINMSGEVKNDEQ